MIGAPKPEQETARLLDLARYQILDTLPEESFDRITRLASQLLNVPGAAISFVDEDRQWNKSVFGTRRREAPRLRSFCAWTILGTAPLLISHTEADPRFAQHSPPTSASRVSSYAGVPLTTPAGHSIGTLYVLDHQPRPWSTREVATLQDLAALVMTELELRVKRLELERELAARAQQVQYLKHTLEQAQVLSAVNDLLDLPLSPELTASAAAALIGEAVAADWTGLVTFREERVHVQAAHGRPATQAPRGVEQRLSTLPREVTRLLLRTVTPLYLAGPFDLAQPDASGDGEGGQAAWVPLGVSDGATFLLLAVRSAGHPVSTWRGGDRTLLEAAGRSVRAALERRAAVAEAERQARQDRLTGLLNRRAFDEHLNEWLTRGTPFTLALADLDGLKAVNDTEGHVQGDRVLQVFAASLVGESGEAEGVYRLGGDEFALLLPAEGSAEWEERVDRAARAASRATALPVGVSLGLASSTEGNGQAAALLEVADARMYSVKHARRARKLWPPR